MRLKRDVRKMQDGNGYKIIPWLRRCLTRVFDEGRNDDLRLQILKNSKAILDRVRMREEARQMESDEDGYLHPSDIDCIRRIYYEQTIGSKMEDSAENFAKSLLTAFLPGDYYHLAYQSLFFSLMELFPDEEFGSTMPWIEHPFVDHDRHICGTADLLAKDTDNNLWVVDFKTIQPRRFLHLPESSYFKDSKQVGSYMKSLRADKGALLYISKDPFTSGLKDALDGLREFHVFPNTAADSAWQDLENAKKADRPPERTHFDVNSPPCQWCEFKDQCFRVDSFFAQETPKTSRMPSRSRTVVRAPALVTPKQVQTSIRPIGFRKKIK